jgi:hypothetical protein
MTSKTSIARIAGKTTFRDYREGFGGITTTDTDADIKAALGVARSREGDLAVRVLELRYVHVLDNERVIRRAWDEEQANRTPARDSHAIAVQRMASALAIRRFAGARMIQHEIDQYAWMVRCRRRVIEDLMRECETWLDGLCKDAGDAFMEAITGIRHGRQERRKEQRTRRAA